MKLLFTICIILLLSSCVNYNSSVEKKFDPYKKFIASGIIKNKIIEVIVRKKLDIPNNKKITKYDIESIIDLKLSGDISSLNGIELFINLETLDLSYQYNLKNISKIKYLKKLKKLVFIENKKIIDISPLKYLTKLESLELYDTGITNINSLKNLKNLRILDLRKNINLSDFTPLISLKYRLTELIIEINNANMNIVSDISVVIYLKKLLKGKKFSKENLLKIKDIDLSSQGLSTIRELSKLKNIEVLNLSGNNLDNIEIIKNFPKLKSLTLNYNNQLTDLTPLSTLKKLKYLNIEDLYLKDYSFIINLTSLDTLKSNIDDLSIIKNLKNLKIFTSNAINIRATSLDLPKIKKIKLIHGVDNGDFLSNLSSLEEVHLPFSNKKIIDSLSKLLNIKFLNINYSSIKNLNSLKKLTKLIVLKCSNCKLVDIDAITKLKELEYINLAHNNITDISPIINLKKVQKLYISKNKIKNKNLLNKLKENNPNIYIDTLSKEAERPYFWEGLGL